MDRGWVDITEQSGADRPAEGATRIIRQAGTLYRQESDGTLGSLGGGGIGWPAVTVIPFISSLNLGVMQNFFTTSFSDTGASVGGANPPTYLSSEDGGVYQFAGPGSGQLSFLGTNIMLATPTATSWVALTRAKIVDDPPTVGGDSYVFCNLWDGVNNEIMISREKAISTNVLNLRFDKAGVTVRTALNAAGTVGQGITVGAWVTFAIAYSAVSGVCTAYVNGVAAGSRSDMASNGPTVGLKPFPRTASGDRRWHLDAMAFATTGPA